MAKKKGGDTRVAATLNGKTVGAPPKADSPFDRQIKVPLHADDYDTLTAFARVDSEESGETVSKQDLIRLAISMYLIDRRIL